MVIFCLHYVFPAFFGSPLLSGLFFLELPSAIYNVSKKNKCVFLKHEENKVAFCGTTVDDCLFICTKDDTWINDQVLMLKNAFQEVSLELGHEIGLVGMQIRMDRELKQVVITQPKHVERIIEIIRSNERCANPCVGQTDGG
jgi:hypothetical protein